MSNIYVQEPPTNGKVLLVTTVGDIDIELWSKEAPKACRNFVQLCMEGYYDGTIFHRVVREFIVQGGDPTGTGSGGESVFGHPFKDEVHSRLRFVRRGLVAMANAGPNDNGSQFFFTMGSTPELMNKHTIFGKVAGNTVFNMLKLQDCETGPDDKPIHPHKILKTQILSNPYDDIIPRILKKKKEHEGEKKTKSKSRATKNFKLLSFGEEAEEDEEQVTKVSEGWKGKSKSSHDLANDPRLSARPALDVSPSRVEKRPADAIEPTDAQKEEQKESVRKKLKKEPEEKAKKQKPTEPPEEKHTPKRQPEEEEPVARMQPVEQPMSKKQPVEQPTLKRQPVEQPISKRQPVEQPMSKRLPVEQPISKRQPVEQSNSKRQPAEQITKSDELKKEAKLLKKEIRESKRREEQRKAGLEETKDDEDDEQPPQASDPLADFKRERQKYKALRKQQGKKGNNREEITLALLEKFKSKLTSVKTVAGDYSDDEEVKEEEDDEGDLSWMKHKLQFEDQSRKVIDANVTDVDRYEIFDPRNPLTVRRREASKQVMKSKR